MLFVICSRCLRFVPVAEATPGGYCAGGCSACREVIPTSRGPLIDMTSGPREDWAELFA
jgi:hypothetical protein